MDLVSFNFKQMIPFILSYLLQSMFYIQYNNGGGLNYFKTALEFRPWAAA